MNDQLTDEQMTELKEALFRGQKIEAIKLYRHATGSGLSQAKAAMDKPEMELRATSSYEFRKPERSGCLGLVVALCVPLGLVLKVLLS